MTKDNVKLEIVKNPRLTQNDVDFNFRVPQELGGLKREITVKRNQLKDLVQTKKYKYVSLAKKLGVTPYHLRRFIDKETLKDDVAQTLFDNLYSTTLEVQEEPQPRFSGVNKMNIRYLFIDHILKSGKLKGNFFTLPSETCAFENELNIQTDNKFYYVSAEHNQDVFMDALQAIAKYKLRMSLTLGKAKAILMKARSEFFAHIFADYCGTFPSFEDEIRHIFTNNLVKRNGLIGLTFTTREANTKNQTSIEFHKSVLNELGIDQTPTTIGGIKLKLLSFMGKNYKFVEFVDYTDTGGHMVFVLIKRVS